MLEIDALTEKVIVELYNTEKDEDGCVNTKYLSLPDQFQLYIILLKQGWKHYDAWIPHTVEEIFAEIF